VDLDIVWEIVERELPALREKIRTTLSKESETDQAGAPEKRG